MAFNHQMQKAGTIRKTRWVKFLHSTSLLHGFIYSTSASGNFGLDFFIS